MPVRFGVVLSCARAVVLYNMFSFWVPGNADSKVLAKQDDMETITAEQTR